MENEARQVLGLPRVVCEYEDIFPNELPGLPPHRDVDFTIELHCDAPKLGGLLTNRQPTENS